MKAKQIVGVVIMVVIIAGIQTPAAVAQSGIRPMLNRLVSRNLDGPRFGMSYALSGDMLIMGMKMQGMGPEFFVSDNNLTTGMVMVVGASFNYGDVCIPVNVAITKKQYGTMLTLMFGYAIEKVRAYGR